MPGHHLQIAQTRAEQENLNRWQRAQWDSWVSGHGEGWAVYAERLMAELGYLSDPGAHLGMLDGQLLYAASVVLDIGLHLELKIPGGASWREARAEARQRAGDAFSLRDFHSAALSLGPMGLDPLREALART